MASSSRSLCIISSALSLATATACSPTTSPLKLSNPFPPGGGIYNFRQSTNGTHVVYLADQETDGVYELYRVPCSGGVPVKLNGPLVAGGDVMIEFQETPDGSHVIYRADLAIDESVELYSVPVAGGLSIRLNNPLAGDGSDVGSDFVVSPDSARVIYRAAPAIFGIDDLFSVPAGGGTPVKLNDSSVITDGIANGPLITPDSQRVVYSARRNNSIFDLYSVPISGGSSIKLNGPLVAGGRVFDYKITPDGARVVYTAEQDTDGVLELYSVPVTGGTVVKLNATLPPGGNVTSDFQATPDGLRVVYLADQSVDGIDELYSVPVTGGAVVKLNGPLVNGGMVWNAARSRHFQISPDGSRVVYIADQDTNEMVELYSVSVSGGGTTKLNGILPGGGDVDSLFSMTPDGTRVIYRADEETDGTGELYSVAVTGGPAIKLNEPLPTGGRILSYLMPPGSSRILYIAEQDASGVAEIYSVPVGGGFPIKLTQDMVAGGDVSTGTVTGDGSFLIYLADQETDGVKELFSVGLIAQTYSDFARSYGLTTPADGDEDSDGARNLIEYLCAGHPMEPGLPPPPTLMVEPGMAELSFVLAPLAVNEIRLEIESSISLAAPGTNEWTVLATWENGIWSGSPVDLARLGSGLVRHTIRNTTSDFNRFYRLKATTILLAPKLTVP